MIKEFELVTYKRIGDLVFGMTSDEVRKLYGDPISTQKCGFPVEDKLLEDHRYFYAIFSNKGLLEEVQFFPEFTEDTLAWIIDGRKTILSTDGEELLETFEDITDDIEEEDTDCYGSERLGVKLYCAEDDIVNVSAHDEHCYDDEKKYLEELKNGEI
jgi:hypothetical protein